MAMIKLRDDRKHQQAIRTRVENGFKNLLLLQPYQYVTQVYGFCFTENNVLILLTELANQGDLKTFLNSRFYYQLNVKKRFGFIIQMIELFYFLHHSPLGTRINCDTSKISRALAQFLVIDNKIVANDLDDFPAVNSKNFANCTWGNVENNYDPLFAAPEEQRTYKGEVGNEVGMTEKVDIWKIPDLVEHMMFKNLPDGLHNEFIKISKELDGMNNKMKRLRPDQRPAIEEVLEAYTRVYESL